jgi:methionyl-tRNA synthetase
MKTDVEVAARGTRIGLNLVVLSAIVAQPFLPDASKTVLDSLGVDERSRKWPDASDASFLDILTPGEGITPPDVLFKKIEDADVAAWAERFGGAD